MPSVDPITRRAGLGVLIAGLALRVLVFAFLNPQMADNHFAVIRYIHNERRLPTAGMINQAYHPPLYHILAAQLLNVGGMKTVQALSLVFSLATLLVIYRFLNRLEWLDPRLRPWCLALPAFHPEFIIYTLVISNDTMSILLGTLLFDQAARCLERPSFGRQTLLAVWLGLGLSTKYTFLAFVLPVAIVIFLADAGPAALATRARAARLAALMLLAAVMGGYRYIDNAARYGNPFVSALDFDYDWIEPQRPTWIGPSTLFDVNIFKLVREPVVTPSTAHSWPLMLYGSFWYSYIPECSFLTNRTPLKWIGSAIDLAALVPTLLMLGGALVWARGLGGNLGAARPETWRRLGIFTLLVLLLNLLLVARTGWKYDVWSVFQGRLLFPSYVGLILLLHEGLRSVREFRLQVVFRIAGASLAVLFLLFFIYLGAEIIHSARHPLPQDFRFYMADYPLNMKSR